MNIVSRIMVIAILLPLVSCATPVSPPSPLPEPTEVESVTLSDFLLGGRWNLVGVTIEDQPVDITATLPVYMRIFDSNDAVESYDILYESNCGENPPNPIKSDGSMTLSSQKDIMLDSGVSEDKECGSARDDARYLLLDFENSVTTYSIDGDAFLWHGIDKASGKPFIMRWVRSTLAVDSTPVSNPTLPNVTYVPMAADGDDAAGVIRYATSNTGQAEFDYEHFQLTMNEQGEAEGPPEMLTIPAKIEFVPSAVFVSPNQQYTVYMQPVEPGGRPYIYNHSTEEVQGLFDNYSGGSFYGWHPDGKSFLFWIDSVGLWLVDAETVDVGAVETTTLADPAGPVQGAAISADGLRIAYIAEDGPMIGALWLVSAAGSDSKVLLDAGSVSYLYPTAWSPDNTRLVYYGDCGDDSVEKGTVTSGPLCIVDLETLKVDSIQLPFSEYQTTWSPNSRYIAATGLTEGEEACTAIPEPEDAETCLYQARTIYLFDTETGTVLPLTDGITPVWSPDGSQFAFYSNRGGSPEVWTIGIDGKNLQQVTADQSAKVPNTLIWQ